DLETVANRQAGLVAAPQFIERKGTTTGEPRCQLHQTDGKMTRWFNLVSGREEAARGVSAIAPQPESRLRTPIILASWRWIISSRQCNTDTIVSEGKAGHRPRRARHRSPILCHPPADCGALPGTSRPVRSRPFAHCLAETAVYRARRWARRAIYHQGVRYT